MEQKQILIVEDNLINIKVTKLLLEECGIKHILTAKTGEEALALFSSTLDLVLLDIGLPDMSGITVCRHFRQRLEGKPLPIIGYSAMIDINKDACQQAGMNDFLCKPAQLSDFEMILQLYLNQH